MSIFYRHGIAMKILRDINSGDESAFTRIAPFLESVDKADAEYKARQEQKIAAREKRAKTGRKNSGAFEVAPRVENGVDYSNTGIVLIRKGKNRLIWRTGGKYFSGIGYQAYGASNLELHVDDGRRVPIDLNKDQPGRRVLSRAMVMRYQKEIDAVFGNGAAERASAIKQTIVLDDPAPTP